MSKYVREVDSIDGLRDTPTSDAAAAHVRTPTGQSGTFVPMDADPFGRGDDGAVAVQARDGAWWVRESYFTNESVSVKDFGAKGDGSDATQAFKDAVSKAQKITSGTQVSPQAGIGVEIYVPRGTYLLSENIQIPVGGVTIRGAGPLSSVIKTRDKSNFTGNSAFTFGNRSDSDSIEFGALKNLMVRGDGTTGANFPSGVFFEKANRWHLENVRFQYVDRPIFVNEGYSGRAFHVDTYHQDRASRIFQSGSDTKFFGCLFRQSEGGSTFGGLQVGASANVLLSGCTFEGNDGSGLVLSDVAAAQVNGCFFEANTRGDILVRKQDSSESTSTSVIGNWFYNTETDNSAITLRNETGSKMGGVFSAGNDFENGYTQALKFKNPGGGGFGLRSINALSNQRESASLTDLPDADEATVRGSAENLGGFSFSNTTSSRTVDGSNTSVGELADTLSTLVGDLESAGIL